MADKKTGSARRPSRDEDEAPKKKQSGTQKPLKKSTSARKAPPEDDEDEAPRPAKKGSSARTSRGDSARSGGGGGPKKGPDNAKIFLYFVPGIILLLLGFGVYLALLPEDKPKGPVTISFDGQVEEAKKKYYSAKAAFQDGNGKEGAAGVPKLAECYRLLCEGHRLIKDVRSKLAALEKSTDKNTTLKEGQTAGDVKKASGQGYAFEDVEKEIGSLKIMCRKALAEREGGMEAIRADVKRDQAEEEKDAGNDPDGLLK